MAAPVVKLGDSAPVRLDDIGLVEVYLASEQHGSGAGVEGASGGDIIVLVDGAAVGMGLEGGASAGCKIDKPDSVEASREVGVGNDVVDQCPCSARGISGQLVG